jgi:hypothetical protein
MVVDSEDSLKQPRLKLDAVGRVSGPRQCAALAKTIFRGDVKIEIIFVLIQKPQNGHVQQ